MVDTLKANTASGTVNIVAEKVGAGDAAIYYDHPGEPITGESMPTGGVSLLGWLTAQAPILRAIRDKLPSLVSGNLPVAVQAGGITQYASNDAQATPTGVVLLFKKDDGTNALSFVSPNNPLFTQQAALALGVDVAAGPAVNYKTLAVTASGNTTLVTPASGKRVYVLSWRASLNSATATVAGLRKSTDTTNDYGNISLVALGQLGGDTFRPSYWPLAVDELLQARLSIASNVLYTVQWIEV